MDIDILETYQRVCNITLHFNITAKYGENEVRVYPNT